MGFVEEEPIRRCRLSQFLWAPGVSQCPISLNLTFINLSAIVAELSVVFGCFYSNVSTSISLQISTISPQIWVQLVAVQHEFSFGLKTVIILKSVWLIFIVRLIENLIPASCNLAVSQKPGQ